MLVDIHFKPFGEDQQANYREFAEKHNAKHPDDQWPLAMSHPPRLARGIYSAVNFSTRSVFENVIEDEPEYRDWRRQRTGDISDHYIAQRAYKREMDKLYSQKYNRGPYRDLYAPYGLCDTPEQLLQLYPHLEDDSVPRFLTFYKITRASQSSSGGFRYHKHGKYIGKQKPRSEYLYDDTHIDFICGFHIYRVEDLISG